MDVIVVFFAVALGFVVVIGVPYLGYWLPNKYGHRKVGIALGSILAVIMLHLAYPEPLQKLLFTKNDARVLLALQNLEVHNEFQVVRNEYNQWSSPSQKLVLNIHAQDRTTLAEQIRSSPGFIKKGDSIPDIKLTNRYFSNPVKIRYETPGALICKSLTPAEKNGYAPIWQTISISKTENELVVEQWYD